jgi:hypothetical protein
LLADRELTLPARVCRKFGMIKYGEVRLT